MTSTELALRLLLDAHVSGPRIGAASRERGHDVVAVDEDRALDGCTDEQLLELATVQRRILVTFDVDAFPRMCREWTEAGRSHHGCAVVVGILHHEFGAIIRALGRTFEGRPQQDDWLSQEALAGICNPHRTEISRLETIVVLSRGLNLSSVAELLDSIA